MKKICTLFLSLFAAALTLQAEVIWSGTLTFGDDWNTAGALQLQTSEYATLANVSDGDIIAVTVDALVEPVTNNPYYVIQKTNWTDLSISNPYGTPEVGVLYFPLTATAAAEVSTDGFIVKGVNYTISKVEILYRKPLWLGSVDATDNWEQTDVLPNSTFAGLQANDLLGVDVATINENNDGWHLYAIRADWRTNFIQQDAGTAKVYLQTLSAADVDSLQNKTIIVVASYLKVTGLYTYVATKSDADNVLLAGNFNDWASSDMLIDDAEHNTCSFTKTLDAGVYEFKLVRGGDWRTLADPSNWITRVYHADWEFPTSGGTNNNVTLDADMAGEYTFTFSYTTGKLTVTYPQTYTRHFDHAYYSTICLPQAATLFNATAYEIAGIVDNYVSLTAPVENLVAGKPYIIKPSADDVDVTATLSGDPVVNTVNGENGLWGVINYGGQPSVDDGNYILSENEFHLVQGGTVNVPRFRGALWVGTTSAPELRIAENATGIENLDANETAVKFIRNGQLLIRKDGVTYTTTGAVVK